MLTLPAVSLTAPWCYLCVAGIKTLETRKGALLSGFSGPLVICRTKAPPADYDLSRFGVTLPAPPYTEDDRGTAADLDMVYNLACAEYGNGHAAGDRDRFARCTEDLARALGLDVRRAPEWGEMVGQVREVVRRDEAAASRWRWTVATTPGGGAILSYRAPGQSGFALIASALPRPDGMLAVRIAGQAHTPADDLPAALATIRAILGADVPAIPTPERSES